MKTSFLALALAAMALAACQPPAQQRRSQKENWLDNDSTDQFDMIARQFRGFDVAMVEVGYRYNELYWAGKDQNWDYAAYQVEKINTAIQNAIVRRPARAASARHFLDAVLPEMQKAVSVKDTVLFAQKYELLKTSCNNCHAREEMPFFTVQTPLARRSPIRNNP